MHTYTKTQLTIGACLAGLLILGGCASANDQSATSTSSASATSQEPAVAGKPQDGISYPNEEFTKLIKDKDVALLDVRTEAEYVSGHIEGAKLLDVTDTAGFKKGLEGLDKTKWYGVYCRSGNRSKTAMLLLREAGFKSFELDGGISAWGGEIVK